MFGTWKYDPETDEVHNLRRAFDPITARSSQHQACDRCHEKKLKCSGDKDGCERCSANELVCEYTRTGSRGSRRGKKSSPRLSDNGRGSSSTPASASSSTQGLPSPERNRASRSRHTRRTFSNGSASPMLPSQAAGEGVLSQLKYPSLSPESTFDMNTLPDGLPQPPRPVPSASSATYTNSHNEHASMLAFTGVDSASYPPWPATSGYDPNLPTSASFMTSYLSASASESRPFLPPAYPLANSYPAYEPLGGFADTVDYSTLDPHFWPPSTQPGQ